MVGKNPLYESTIITCANMPRLPSSSELKRSSKPSSTCLCVDFERIGGEQIWRDIHPRSLSAELKRSYSPVTAAAEGIPRADDAPELEATFS
jgi:hypothetical protein